MLHPFHTKTDTTPLWPTLLGYLGIFGVLALIRWSTLPLIVTNFIGGASHDAGLYVWLVRNFVADPLRAFSLESNAFYPYSTSLAWSDNFLLPSFISAILQNLLLSEIAAYNLIILFAQLLNGLCTLELSKYLKGSPLASFVAGSTFMASAYMGANMGHPQLQFAFLLPLGVMAIFKLCNQQSYLYALSLGLIISTAFYTTVYYAVFLVIASVWLGPLITTSKRMALNPAKLSLCFFSFVLGLAPIISLLPSYFLVRDTFSPRALYEAYYFSATGLSYLSHPQLSWVYSWTTYLSHDEAHLGFGLAALLLLCVLCVRHMSKSISSVVSLISLFLALALSSLSRTNPYILQLTTLFSWIALVGVVLWVVKSTRKDRSSDDLSILISLLFLFLILSLGPLGNPTKGNLAWSPFVVFHYVIPGVNAIRAVGRFGVLVVMCAATALPLLIERFILKRSLSSLALLSLLAISLVENHLSAYPMETVAPVPSAVNELKKLIKQDEAALILPMAGEVKNGAILSWGNFAELNVNDMLWFSDSHGSLINGYSGQRSKLMLELPILTDRFPDTRSIARLSTIAGLRYIVVLGSLIPNFDRNATLEKIKEFSSLNLISEPSPKDLVLEFNPILKLSPSIGTQPYLLVPSQNGTSILADIKIIEGSSTCELTTNWVETTNEDERELKSPNHTSTIKISSDSPKILLSVPNEELSIRPRIMTFNSSCSLEITKIVLSGQIKMLKSPD